MESFTKTEKTPQKQRPEISQKVIGIKDYVREMTIATGDYSISNQEPVHYTEPETDELLCIQANPRILGIIINIFTRGVKFDVLMNEINNLIIELNFRVKDFKQTTRTINILKSDYPHRHLLKKLTINEGLTICIAMLDVADLDYEENPALKAIVENLPLP